MARIRLRGTRVETSGAPSGLPPTWPHGIRITYTDDIWFRRGRGDPIGEQHGFVIVVRKLSSYVKFLNVTTFILPEGQISAQGVFDSAVILRPRLAITGGTNKYKKIRGEVYGEVDYSRYPIITGTFTIKY
jgi:hypothetical protein